MIRKRITVIDKDESFQFFVSSIIKLSGKFDLTGCYFDPYQAIRNIQKNRPDIIITDLLFPNAMPIEYLKLLVEKAPFVDVLVVTDYDEESFVVDAITNGASGYLLKRNHLTNLVDAINSVASGGAPLDDTVARTLIRNIQINKVTPLTNRESSVLKLITQGKTYSMIAKELQISNETSKTHIKNIYKKLHVNSKTEAVRKAISDRLIHIAS